VSGLWSTTQCPPTLQRSTKLKISHWYFEVSLPHQDVIFCSKHLEQAFFYIIFFIHIYLMRCLSSVVSLNAVTALLLTSCLQCCKQRIFSMNTSYFCVVRISISLAILCETFVQIGYLFSKSYARTEKWVFFSEHSVYCICLLPFLCLLSIQVVYTDCYCNKWFVSRSSELHKSCHASRITNSSSWGWSNKSWRQNNHQRCVHISLL